MKPGTARILVVFGILLVLLGMIFMGMYAWEAVISRIGDPDQSLLFWYLPILFIGIFAMLGGLLLLYLGRTRLRTIRNADQD